VWLRVSWLAPVGVVLVGGFFVVPHILRIHHFLLRSHVRPAVYRLAATPRLVLECAFTASTADTKLQQIAGFVTREHRQARYDSADAT
jgi:hypothetical protein